MDNKNVITLVHFIAYHRYLSGVENLTRLRFCRITGLTSDSTPLLSSSLELDEESLEPSKSELLLCHIIGCCLARRAGL